MKKFILPLASLISSVMIAGPVQAQVPLQDQVASQDQAFNQSQVQTAAQQRIQKIQDLVRAAGSHGLLYSFYFNAASETELQTLAAVNEVALDKKLTAIVSRLANDLSRGRVLPTAVGGKASLKAKAFAYQLVANGYLNGNMSSYEFISAVAPKNRIYREAQEMVQHLMNLKSQNNWVIKPVSLVLATVSTKTTDAALIKYTREKLYAFGYYNNLSSSVYDTDLEYAIRAFQTDNGLTSDGIAGTSVTWKYLDKNIEQLTTQAILNLDRTRWLPEQSAAEYIFINLARQTFDYYENEFSTLSFRTINGRLDRQTPIMVDSATKVILNPTWGVTYNIFTKDKIPLLRKDPNYADLNHMKLYSANSEQRIDPLSVDWSQSPGNLPYRLVQDPGPWNALGFIKFPLTNGFSIYMHDTNDRHLFADDDRLKSSGCIRLQQPFDVAEKLLKSPEWTASSLQAATEFAPTQALKPTDIKLKRSVPVYIFYQTMLQSNGKIIASNDSYRIDELMYNLMITGN